MFGKKNGNRYEIKYKLVEFQETNSPLTITSPLFFVRVRANSLNEVERLAMTKIQKRHKLKNTRSIFTTVITCYK